MISTALGDLLNPVLLTYYLEDVSRLSGKIVTVAGESVLAFGDESKVPALTSELLEKLNQSPLPIDVAGGRACGLYGRSEIIGYAVISTTGESEIGAADFAFQMMSDQISMRISNNEKEFDASYQKSIISIMQRLMHKMAAVFDVDRAAEVFLKECQALFGARTGAIVLIESNELRVAASFGGAFNDQETARYACFSQQSIISNDVGTDLRFKRQDSEGRAVKLGFKNVLCVPLISNQKPLGAIYFNDKEIGAFWDEDQRMAQTLAVLLSSTIASIKLHNDLVRNERIKSNLERYLSPNLVKEIISTGELPKLGGSRVQATILFSDIRGFTKMSEKITPEQMVLQLNEYFEEMAKIIFSYDGTLDKYVGDMIMVLFGVPKAMNDASVRALKTAVAMQEKLKSLNERWKSESKPTFEVGIGINAGEVVFGNIGSSTAMGLTVIGDHVNCAQRLEAYAKEGQIMIGESVYAAISNEGFTAVDLGVIESGNKSIRAYRVDY